MSAKWRRVQRWDDRTFRGPLLLPVKYVLRAFSSIAMAVVLLLGISLFGVLASVPVGMLARLPTLAIVAGSVLLCAGIPAVGAVVIAFRLTRERGRAARFLAMFGGGVLAGTIGSVAWATLLVPVLWHDPATGRGLLLFADVIERYRATTVRRLPGLEMTELEFYGWWPMRLMLVLFIVNMVVATLRRIEFTFRNLGVLTVHSGIITMALGAVYYEALKEEGDTLLRSASSMGVEAPPGTPGPRQTGFYDNVRVALWVDTIDPVVGGRRWEQWPMRGVPRYNDYALDAGVPDLAGLSMLERLRRLDPDDADDGGRTLDIPARPARGFTSGAVGLRARAVGYAHYAERFEDAWLMDEPPPGLPPHELQPARSVVVRGRFPNGGGPDGLHLEFIVEPLRPAHRIQEHALLGVECTIAMDEGRWRAWNTPNPAGSPYLVVVEIPDGPRSVIPATPGSPATPVLVGGWAVELLTVGPEPDLPIITEGYRNAPTAAATLRITPPAGHDAAARGPFERSVFARFPELDQDVRGMRPDGRPDREPASRDIRVWLVDDSRVQVVFDDRPVAGGWRSRVVFRNAGDGVESFDTDHLAFTTAPGDPQGRLTRPLRFEDFAPADEGIAIAIAHRWAHAARFTRPAPVPEHERENDRIGTHLASLLAVELTHEADPAWRRVEWLPFTQYVGETRAESRRVALPGGAEVGLVFGRLYRPFREFSLRMVDFEMKPFAHGGPPRDFQSVVRVEPWPATERPGFEPFDHLVRLNSPLRAPPLWQDGLPLTQNLNAFASRLLSPTRFKLSQSGWDRDGWEETRAMAERGELERPIARFTILGVGNNPGIQIIAVGLTMMGVGIPWAFYVKPWLVRREARRKIAEREAATAATHNAPAGPHAPAVTAIEHAPANG